MADSVMWLIAGLLTVSVCLNGILLQMDFSDPFTDPDVCGEGPEGPKINDYHDEDQPDAENKEQ
jgi:hypothetical protein